VTKQRQIEDPVERGIVETHPLAERESQRAHLQARLERYSETDICCQRKCRDCLSHADA
jgi:hypothetical protein